MKIKLNAGESVVIRVVQNKTDKNYDVNAKFFNLSGIEFSENTKWTFSKLDKVGVSDLGLYLLDEPRMLEYLSNQKAVIIEHNGESPVYRLAANDPQDSKVFKTSKELANHCLDSLQEEPTCE